MIINLKSKTDLSGFYIVYEGSTNLEKSRWYGISHLMEHLVCKTFFSLLEDFDRDSIDWNAYTTSNEIVFHFTGLDSKLKSYIPKIVKLIQNFDISKSQFETERSIVLQEYEDCFNDQSQSHQLNLQRKLFNDFDPIGLKSDLINLKYLDCLNFFDLQYSKPTKIINVSKFSKYSNLDLEFSNNKIDKIYEYGNHKNDFEINNEFKDKTSLIMLSPFVSENNAQIHFLNAMISMGLKSPLYTEVREKKGLVYFIHCYQHRMNKQGITMIDTLTSNKNVNKVIDSVKYVLDNPKLFLNKDRFELVKNYYSTRSQKEEILRYNYVNKYINPDGWTVYDILDKITLKELKNIYEQYYDFDKFYISNDKKEFKS